jgi:two-component system, OmpR family, response regulator
MIKFKIFGFGSNQDARPASPQAEAPLLPAPSGDTASPPAGIPGKRVLIVDDDRIFLRTTARKLETAGFHVRTAREGPEAIAALGEEAADTILLDLMFEPDVGHGGMGSWDGFQIMTWLRGSPAARGARFIMVSGSDAPADRQRAQQLGAAAFLHKPVDHDQLLAAIDAGN